MAGWVVAFYRLSGLLDDPDGFTDALGAVHDRIIEDREALCRQAYHDGFQAGHAAAARDGVRPLRAWLATLPVDEARRHLREAMGALEGDLEHIEERDGWWS